MSEVILDSNNFEVEVNNTDKLVLVDFFATWCGPCKMIAPILSDIAKEYSDKVKVCKVNVDENNELAMKYDISSIPTLIFLKDGKVVETSIGFSSKSEIVNILNKLI